MSIRILLAAYNKPARQGIRRLIGDSKDMHIVGESSTVTDAERRYRELDPDIVITEASMEQINCITLTRQLKECNSKARVIALTTQAHEKLVGQLLEAGAAGYLSKDCPQEELHEAIHTVISGKIYLDRHIKTVLVDDYIQRITRTAKHRSRPLSRYEIAILQLIAEGFSASEIADMWYSDLDRIENQQAQIMKKLELSSIAELTKYAVKQGLTSVDK